MSWRSRFSRRAFLGGAAAVAIPGAAVAAAELAGSSGPQQGKHATAAARHGVPQRRTVSENSLPGDPDWYITDQGAPDAILGYAGQSGVPPGQPVDLYVSTTSREFSVTAFRIGWYGGDLARRVWQSGAVRGGRQRAAVMAAETSTVHADWGVSLSVPTDDWPPGSYLLRLDAYSGGQRYVPLTVRSASTAGKVVLKNGVATWQAYNTWGGYDLYMGPDGQYDSRALAVSLDRPYDQEGAYLFMVYERKLINLAERMGLPLAYLTSMDIAADAHALDGASALISPGHDEYWSPPERAHVTAARDAGVNLAFLGANAMFRRTRLEPTSLGADRLVVCYRTSYQQDPMYGKDNALVTSDWRDRRTRDPESSVTGTLYESFPAVADYVVASAGCLDVPGDRRGEGHQVRRAGRHRVRPGQPGLSRAAADPGAGPLTADLQRREQLSGHGVLHAPGGAGVFNVGTMRWVESFGPPTYGWGITAACSRFTRRVTANVLRAFADGPAAARYPAQDNLDAMDEWPGDPIAAQHDLWPPVVL